LPNFDNSLGKEINVQRSFSKASRNRAPIFSAIDTSRGFEGDVAKGRSNSRELGCRRELFGGLPAAFAGGGGSHTVSIILEF
jgi:hypothetical protein